MGRFKYFFFVLMVLTIISCYNENKPPLDKPEPFLNENEMVEVLTDIQLAEGIFIYHRQKASVASDPYKDSLFQVVFDHYNITSRILRDNINYYNTNPKLMEKIYEKVLTNLSKKQSEITIEATKLDMARKAVRKAAEEVMKEEEEPVPALQNDSIL